MEPPDHTRLRRLISTAFARGHVERLRPWVEELAGRLVDGLVERSGGTEPVDVLSGMAEQLPVAVIAELLGVPDADRPLLRPWSNAIVKMYEYGRTTAVEDAAERAAAEFVAYLRELAAERRRHPGEDLLSHLVQVRDAEGDRLTEDELVTTCILLLNAGHEATVNVSGNGMLALLRTPTNCGGCAADRAAAADRDRGADALRLAAAAVRAHRHRGRRDRRDHRRGGPEDRRAARVGQPRPGGVRRRRTRSTSAAPTTRTSPSAPACTSASGRRWPASSCRRRSARCSTGRRRSSWAPSRAAVPSSSSAAWPTCPSSSPAERYGPPVDGLARPAEELG